MRQSARIATTKVGRNDPCPCGSGAKYKHCCEGKDLRDVPFLGASQVSNPGAARSVSALSRAAREHWEAGRWVEANSLYREIARLCPANPQAHHDLGITFLRLGMLGEAAGSLRKAIDLRPGFESALIHLAYVEEEVGHEDNALSIYRRLSRSVESAAQRRYHLAKVLAMEGRRDEAEIELRRVAVLEPHFASARVLLGSLLGTWGFRRGHTTADSRARRSPQRFPATIRGEAHDRGGPRFGHSHVRPCSTAGNRHANSAERSFRSREILRRSRRLSAGD